MNKLFRKRRKLDQPIANNNSTGTQHEDNSSIESTSPSSNNFRIYKEPTEVSYLAILKIALNCRVKRSRLKRFLLAFHCCEGVLFWEDVRNFKTVYEFDKDNTIFLYTQICKQFIETGADHEINISDTMRHSILESLQSKCLPPRDVFAPAVHQVITMLSHGVFRRFVVFDTQ